MGVSSILSSLRNNIVGQNSTPTNPSLPAKRTPIEIAQDTGPLASLGYDPLGFSTHAYPLDVVNNPEIGHYMLFYINVQNNTTFPYTDVRGVDVRGRTIKREIANQVDLDQGFTDKIEYTGEETFSGGGGGGTVAESFSEVSINAEPHRLTTCPNRRLGSFSTHV